MAVCGLRTLLLIVCVVELIVTVQRQIFDFLGYMWLPIIANFLNILLIIFGSFGAVQHISKYLLAYAIWSFMWLMWNVFLICYYLNLGTLNRESGLLSLGTGSVSWWEGNGWGCQPVWGEEGDTLLDNSVAWRPVRVDGCLVAWWRVELAQSALSALLAAAALPPAAALAWKPRLHPRLPQPSDKSTLGRRDVFTVETPLSESLKPMTPRRVKRRSTRQGSGRRSRRSYRNQAYTASTVSLPRDPRPSRPTSAHSSYSNFHEARPISYQGPEESTRSQELYNPPPPPDVTAHNRYEHVGYPPPPSGHDVAGPYNDPPRNYEVNKTYDNLPRHYDPRADTVSPYDSRADTVSPYDSRADTVSPYDRGEVYEPPVYRNTGYGTVSYGGAPPPPAPPYSSRATPQAPGPPAYQPTLDHYPNHNRI